MIKIEVEHLRSGAIEYIKNKLKKLNRTIEQTKETRFPIDLIEQLNNLVLNEQLLL